MMPSRCQKTINMTSHRFFTKGDKAMWIYANPNPSARKVGDCSVRAVSIALGISWEDAYEQIANAGFQMNDMPSSDSVWGSVLRRHGFYRAAIPNRCPDCYTAADFCADNQHGVFVLCFSGHVAAVIDGNIYDTWDSSQEIPQYYWYRKER